VRRRKSGGGGSGGLKDNENDFFSSRKEKGPGLPGTTAAGVAVAAAVVVRRSGGGGCVTCIYAAAVRCVRGGCARARLFCMQDTTILHVSGAGAKEGRLPELWSAAAVYIRGRRTRRGLRGERERESRRLEEYI